LFYGGGFVMALLWGCVFFRFWRSWRVGIYSLRIHFNRSIMAKVKFGAMMTDARGKLGGHVFSKNRGGAYLRTKVTPSNPQTEAQVSQRALLSQFSQNWRTLTEAQRLAWSAVVPQYATTNVFGDLVNPSGSNLYTRLNINAAIAGGSAISTPPLPLGTATASNLVVTADVSDGSVELAFDPATVPTGQVMVVEATPQLSPGIDNANSQFRQIAVLPAATASGADVAADYIAKFGGLTAGRKMMVRVKFIRIATGEVSQSLVASTIVVA
jgi:hypothetical protein